MFFYVYKLLRCNKNKQHRSLKYLIKVKKVFKKSPSLLKEKVKESPSIPSKISFTFFLKEFFEGFAGQ